MNILCIWIIIEINTLAFSNILREKKNSESSLIYLSINTLPALAFILSLVFTETLTNKQNLWTIILIIIARITKIGLFPFHSWIFRISKFISKMNILLILTIQKIIPLKLFSILVSNKLLIFMIIINVFKGNIISFSSIEISNFLIGSSINYRSWIIIMSTVSLKLSLTFLFIYIRIILNLFIAINKKAKNLKLNNNYRLIVAISLFIRSPPFPGFIIKTLFINYIAIIENKINIILIFRFILISFFSSILYLQLLFTEIQIVINTGKKINKWIYTTIFIISIILFISFLII